MNLRTEMFSELDRIYPRTKLMAQMTDAISLDGIGRMEPKLVGIYTGFVEAVITTAVKLVEKHTVAPAPAPFPTDKLEFWEQCFIAALPTVHGSALSANHVATDALLKRNNLIALLGEQNEP